MLQKARFSALPSSSMVEKLPLIWNQKHVKEKLSSHDSLKAKSTFACRVFAYRICGSEILSGFKSSVPSRWRVFTSFIYDQPRLKNFESRDYEKNRRTALDVFFLKTLKTHDMFPGIPGLQVSTFKEHKTINSSLLGKLEKTLWLYPRLGVSINGGTSKS